MTIYVDDLMNRRWKMRGKVVQSCHMFTDPGNEVALHDFADLIGIKRHWFQDKAMVPHYDLTTAKRSLAIDAGAIPLNRSQAAAIYQEHRHDGKL